MKLYLTRTVCNMSFMLVDENFELAGHYLSLEQLGTFMELCGYVPDYSVSHLSFYNDITEALGKIGEFRTTSEIKEMLDWFVVNDLQEIRNQIELSKLRSYSEIHVS